MVAAAALLYRPRRLVLLLLLLVVVLALVLLLLQWFECCLRRPHALYFRFSESLILNYYHYYFLDWIIDLFIHHTLPTFHFHFPFSIFHLLFLKIGSFSE
jgi:hypothetical protein